jgi:DNA-binding transcriptional LysR family regulator
MCVVRLLAVLQVIRLKGALNEKEMELIELREQHMQLVVRKLHTLRKQNPELHTHQLHKRPLYTLTAVCSAAPSFWTAAAQKAWADSPMSRCHHTCSSTQQLSQKPGT